MADLAERFVLNVPGRFFTDTSCVDCGLCTELAPLSFRRDDESGQSYVFHQPDTEEAEALALEAMGHCPTESIGLED